MTWRERRTVSILCAILGVLCIALVLVLGWKYREKRAEPAASASAAAAMAEDHSTCTALTYFNGSETLEFRRSESGKWYWAADESFPLDDSTITSILETLSALAPQQTLEAVESLEDLGLTEASPTITALYDSGAAYTLTFGSATTDGKSRYATQNGKSSPVYIFPGEILELMALGVYDMCLLPQLPDLSPEQVQRVTIQGTANAEGQVPRCTMDAETSGETVKWITGSHKNITDSPRVTALFEDLSALAYDRCVSYRPSAGALELCGFSAPTATLWANYTTSTDLEGHFQLMVGSLTLDGKSRYVRVGEDESIYSMPTELLDAILVIALSGFEG